MAVKPCPRCKERMIEGLYTCWTCYAKEEYGITGLEGSDLTKYVCECGIHTTGDKRGKACPHSNQGPEFEKEPIAEPKPDRKKLTDYNYRMEEVYGVEPTNKREWPLEWKIAEAYNNIDRALIMKNKELFMQYTRELNELLAVKEAVK